MRAGCKRALALIASLAAIAGCNDAEDQQCVEGFCLPADVVIVGRERPADFTLYQLAWRGEQFGLYVGDAPSFAAASAQLFAVPLDRNAQAVAGGGSAEVVMRLGEASPRFLHLGGRCDEIQTCNVGELAQAITRAR